MQIGAYTQSAVQEAIIEAEVMGKGPVMIVLEKSTASPQMGVSSAFNYGVAYGRITAEVELLLSESVHLWRVAPATWKSHLGLLKQPKSAATKKAKSKWPELKWNSHKADAALMAFFAMDFKK